MSDLSAFPITKKWPATNPDVLQLYTLATPNGVKVSIALEEMGIAYEAHTVSFATNDQMSEEFLSLNPNNKIPAILDPNGPDGKPLALFESGAILLYLAEKSGQFLPSDPVARIECIQWLMFQMGGVGPMFGQFGHFYKFAADKVNDPYPKERYLNEAKRLLGVMDDLLAKRDYICGDEYTIADMAIVPWLWCLVRYYDAADALELEGFKNVIAYRDRVMARPAFEKGLAVPA